MESQDLKCITNIVENTAKEYVSSDSQIPFRVKFLKSSKRGKNNEDESEIVFLNVPDLFSVIISETVKQVIERQDVKNKEEREFFESEIKKRDEIIDKLQGEVRELQYQSDCSVQYSMRNNLKITGVKYEKEENVKEKFIQIVSDLGIEIQENDLDTIHRVGTKQDTVDSSGRTVVPSIIARLKIRDMRDKIFDARKKLREHSDYDSVYINDHVTPLRNRIMYELRNRENKQMFKFVWSRQGKIYARKFSEITNDRNNQPKPHVIQRPEDLKSLGWSNDEIENIILNKRK